MGGRKCKVESIPKPVVCLHCFVVRYFLTKFGLLFLLFAEMKLKLSNPYYHILFWLVVVSLLTLFFNRSWGSGINTFYFIGMLLPVVMGTSYFFNFYLVPRYLLKKKYAWFVLYFFYLLVVSIYLEMWVLMFSYMYLANFSMAEMGAGSTDDVILLTVVMYMIVFAGSFLIMLQQLAKRQKELELYREEEEKRKNAFLELLSNRQLVRIPFNEITYIESLSDYITIHSSNRKSITSKEKISVVAGKLPGTFIRIHRSFIVNTEKITRFTANEVEINGVEFNIGRTYKKDVAEALKTP